MTQYQDQGSFAVPPQQVYVPPERKAIWPTPIGVISIIFGSLGMIMALVNLALGRTAGQQPEGMPDLPEWFITWTWVESLIGLGLGMLLVIAGICLLRRRAAGRALHISYALLDICTIIVNVSLTLTAILPLVRGSNAPGPAETGMILGTLFGAVIAGMFSLAYPVFLLIWFARGKIRRDVAAWTVGRGELGIGEQTYGEAFR